MWLTAKRQTDSVTLQLDKKVEIALFDKRVGALDTGLSNQEHALQRVADLLNNRSLLSLY